MSTDQSKATASGIFDRVRVSTDILVAAMARLELWQSYKRAADRLMYEHNVTAAPPELQAHLQQSSDIAAERIENVMQFICEHRAKHDRLMEVYNNQS